MKLLITLKNIVYILLCLHITHVHEQFTKYRELFMNIRELGGYFFAKYHTCHGIEKRKAKYSYIPSFKAHNISYSAAVALWVLRTYV